MNDKQRRERLELLAPKTTYVEFRSISDTYELRWPFPRENSLRPIAYKQVAVIDASTGKVVKYSCASEKGLLIESPQNYLEKVDRRIRYLLTRLRRMEK